MSWSTNPVISFEKGRYLITYLLLFAVALWAMQRAEARSGLAAALFLGYLTQRVGLSPIVGYLLAGVAVGPNTPGFAVTAVMVAL